MPAGLRWRYLADWWGSRLISFVASFVSLFKNASVWPFTYELTHIKGTEETNFSIWLQTGSVNGILGKDWCYRCFAILKTMFLWMPKQQQVDRQSSYILQYVTLLLRMDRSHWRAQIIADDHHKFTFLFELYWSICVFCLFFKFLGWAIKRGNVKRAQKVDYMTSIV